MKYLTRDNITLALSIIGSVGTLLTWLLTFINSRRNIKLKVIKYCKLHNSLIMYMVINNNSSSSIILNSVSVKLNDIIYPCSTSPKRVFAFQNKTGEIVNYSKDYFSVEFPINLSSCSGMSGYFLFDIPEEDLKTLSTPLILQVSSNRGKSLEIELKLENEVNWDKMY